MRTNPVYQFETANDVGIDIVPVNSKVLIADFNGLPKEVFKTSLGTLNPTSTIAEFLADNALQSSVDTGGILNDISGTTSVTTEIWTGTQLEYDDLSAYTDSTLYFIK